MKMNNVANRQDATLFLPAKLTGRWSREKRGHVHAFGLDWGKKGLLPYDNKKNMQSRFGKIRRLYLFINASVCVGGYFYIHSNLGEFGFFFLCTFSRVTQRCAPKTFERGPPTADRRKRGVRKVLVKKKRKKTSCNLLILSGR